jgi:DNA-binding transcriptional regulator YdaS (Cro superfamily)
MKISEYIAQFPKDQRKRICQYIARKLKVGESSINHWRNGTRRISPLLALRLENLTNGLITRSELRPDIYPPENTEENVADKH